MFETKLAAPFFEMIKKGKKAVLDFFEGLGTNRNIEREEEIKSTFRRGFNPYIAGPPIRTPAMFFGRASIIMNILNGIQQNHFLIEDERRIGKTSLLYHLKYNLEQDIHDHYSFFPVFANIEATSEVEFWEHLRNSLFSTMGKTRPSESNNYDFNAFRDDLDEMLSKMETQAQAKDVRIIFLIDEADRFAQYSDNCMAKFRKLFLEDERLKVIITGTNMRYKLNDIASPWHNQLIFVQLGTLSAQEARSLIVDPVKGIYTYDEPAIELILKESQNKPLAIQTICFEAVNIMLNRVNNNENATKDLMILLEDVQKTPYIIGLKGKKISHKRNPYINGATIREDFNFYNRLDIVNELSTLSARAYYIKGNRRIGKTSLLRQLERKMLSTPEVLPVYFNLEGSQNWKEVQNFFQRAIHIACRNIGIEEFNCPIDLIEALIFSLEQSAELGKHFYLLIDEAEALLHLPLDMLSKFHRELVNTHEHLTIVVSASNRLQNFALEKIEGFYLLENFHIINLGLLPKEDALKLIRQSQNPLGEMIVDAALAQDILEHTGCHPFLIQRLCFNLFENGKLRSIKEADYVLTQELRNFLAVDFNLLTKEQQSVLQEFTWQEPKANSEITKFSLPTINSSLAELERLGFLTNENNQYKLSNYYLAQWLEEQQSKRSTPNTMPKLNVFISYSHKDEPFKDALDTHLTMLKRSDKIATWNDRAILAGTEWDDEIKAQLEQAHIIILLISANFLASKYIWENELTLAMEWHKRKEVQIIPVFIKPCDWKDAPFGSVQGLPRDAKPVGHADNDESWVGVAKGIRDLVDDLLQKGGAAKKTSTTITTSNPTSTGVEPSNSTHLTQILPLIDSDMLAAFDLLDKLNWGNHKGTYNDKKAEWIDPGIGFNKPQFRERLKLLIKSVFG